MTVAVIPVSHTPLWRRTSPGTAFVLFVSKKKAGRFETNAIWGVYEASGAYRVTRVSDSEGRPERRDDNGQKKSKRLRLRDETSRE